MLKFYINTNQFESNMEDLINNDFQKTNLLIFLKYLVKILKEYDDSYSSNSFKINLSLLFSFLRKKNVEEAIESKDYFYLSIKELQKEFPDEKILNELSIVWKQKYDFFKIRFLKQIKDLEIPVTQRNNANLLDERTNLAIDFKKNNINENNIQAYIKKNDNLITTQLNSLIKSIGLEEKNINTFKEIFFNLSNVDEMVALIMVIKEINTEILDIIDYYNQRHNSKDIMNDMTETLEGIAKNDSFYEKLKNILNSKVVKDYFKYKRNFSGLYETEVTDKDDCDVNLSSAYEEFMKKLCEDKNWFFNLIRYKSLPLGKRAFVNENLKIFLNPLYIHVTKVIDMNEKNEFNDLEKILTSYLIIIFIHEIIHLLKFIKAKKDKKEYNDLSHLPSTPKQKEGGEVFINYLFKKPIINRISLEQCEELLNLENWNDSNKLYKIFEKDAFEKGQKPSLAINFYLSEKKPKKKKGWFNMN